MGFKCCFFNKWIGLNWNKSGGQPVVQKQPPEQGCTHWEWFSADRGAHTHRTTPVRTFLVLYFSDTSPIRNIHTVFLLTATDLMQQTSVGEVMYEIPWPESPSTLKTAVMLTTAQARNTMQLSGWRMYWLGLPTFVEVRTVQLHRNNSMLVYVALVL